MLIADCKIKLIVSAFYFHEVGLKIAERRKTLILQIPC